MDAIDLATLTSFATLLTAIATLVMVLELRNQRKSSIKPELIAVKQSVFAQKSEMLEFPAPIGWVDSIEHKSDDRFSGLEYFAKIFNVGNGPAKDVLFRWSFNRSELSDNINNNAIGQLVVNHSENDELHITPPDRGASWINMSLDLIRKTDFLLPISVHDRPHLVHFPRSYIHLASLMLSMSVNSEKEKSYPTTLPAIYLEISYSDRDGSAHSKFYKYNFEITAFSFDDDGSLGSFSAILNPAQE